MRTRVYLMRDRDQHPVIIVKYESRTCMDYRHDEDGGPSAVPCPSLSLEVRGGAVDAVVSTMCSDIETQAGQALRHKGLKA